MKGRREIWDGNVKKKEIEDYEMDKNENEIMIKGRNIKEE